LTSNGPDPCRINFKLIYVYTRKPFYLEIEEKSVRALTSANRERKWET